MPTAFGPQGANAVDSPPGGITNNNYGTSTDTWVQDCVPGANSGTVLDAAFYNMIIGNLRTAVSDATNAGATFTLADGDLTLLSQAIQYWSSQGGISVVAPLQISPAGQISIDIAALTLVLP